MVKTLNFQFCKLTFIKTDNEELNQLENTILMRAIFNEYNQPLPLKKALSKTQYGFSASAQNSGNCRLLRITDIKEDGIDWDTVPFCDCNEIEKYRLNEKDILITRTGGTTGKTTLIQEIKETSIFASYLIRLSVSEDYNPEYIYLFLNSYLFWNQILDLKNGTAQPNVNANKMTTIIFPSCPKEIQDKIVEYKKDKTVQISVLKQVQSDFQKINISYENLKSIIIENKKQTNIISQLKQAILQEAISGQLTAEWRKQNPIQKGNTDTDAAALLAKIKAYWKANQIKYNRLSLRAYNKGQLVKESDTDLSWVSTNIDSIGIVKVGSTPTRNEPKYWNGQVNWISSGEVANNIITKSNEQITDIAVKNTSLHLCPVGTVLIAMIGQGKTRGQSSILQIEAATNQNVAAIIIDHGYINSKYLWYFFLSKYLETRQIASGGNQPALNSVKVGSFPFPLPPLAEQKAIVEKVDYLMKIIDQLEAQIKHRKQLAEDLMQTVLREAFE
ncbi:restriction endonuclease subunit S [Planktothrix agardhii]|uniref:restriction endonuclease subunit S n=1 Tax=Planktothrix agardhii TaxID=1160 RepID=UPI00041DEA50|nr:restriction endonuclease subunit S [Planktothrix agardhii]